jgi:error-prone DNA polymerase
VLGTGMVGVRGRVQRAGEVVHIVAYDLIDLSADLASVGAREAEAEQDGIRIRARDFR